MILGALLVLLIFPAAAAAEETVNEVAVKLPPAIDAGTAAAQQAALRPSVEAAVARGEGPALLKSTNPSVLADLVPYSTVTPTTGETGRHSKRRPKLRRHPKPGVEPPAGEVPGAQIARVHPVAHAAGCWGWAWTQHDITVFGGNPIAWIYVRENGWCGNGYSMTWLGGPTFANWEWGPYCLTNHGENYTWDYWPTWVHMANWGTVGVSYPWGCFGLRGEKVVVRIAANGYWDTWNDYGF